MQKSDDTSHYQIFRRKKGDTEFISVAYSTDADYEDRGLGIKESYEYQVVAYDQVGNESVSAVAVAKTTGIDVTAPECFIPDYMNGKPSREVKFDGLMCEDNAGITSYYWDFGDGTASKRTVATHTYAENGDYTYSLTVKDAAGNTSTKSGTISIKDKGNMLVLRVLDTEGQPLSGASVVVNSDTVNVFSTDQTGYAYIITDSEEVNVNIYKDGYGMTEQTVHLSGEEEETVNVRLESASKVTGTLEYHEMSYEEMRAMGVDFESTQNQNVVRYVLNLEFQKSNIPVRYEYCLVENEEGESEFLDERGKRPVISDSVTNDDGSVTWYEIRPSKAGIVCLTQTETVAYLYP